MSLKSFIESFLECAISTHSYTKHIAEEPISLSCGHTICQKCITNQLSNQIMCNKCDKLVTNSNQESVAVKNALMSSANELFQYLKDKYKYHAYQILKSENVTSFNFENLIDEVDIRTESLKIELDKLRDQLHAEILTEKDKFFTRKSLSDSIVDEVFKKYEHEMQEIDETIMSYDSSNKCVTEAPNKTIIGLLSVSIGTPITQEITQSQVTSSILDPGDVDDLIEVCQLNPNSKWALLYRGSVHGWKSIDFHLRCDGKKQTLTVIKSSDKSIFGGFTSVKWSSKMGFKNDPQAFIYSLRNLYAKKYKALVRNIDHAIYCHPSYGPTFGGHYDGGKNKEIPNETLRQPDLSVSNESHSNMNCSYFPQMYNASELKIKDLVGLAGARKFSIEEIEVFAIHE